MLALYQQLKMFGWVALWNPDKIVLVLVVGGLYALLVGPYRRDIPGATPPKPAEVAAFYGALGLYYVAQGSPLYLMSHMIFWLHMVKMAIVYLLVPPLLILGIPAWMFETAFRMAWLRRLVGALSHPLVAIFLFNGLFSIYHIPEVFDFLNTHRSAGILYAIAMFAAAWIMWWPILNPLPDREEWSYIKKIGYIFANGMLLTPACALLFLSDHVLYRSYYDAAVWQQMVGYCLPPGARAIDLSGLSAAQFNLLSPVDDQKLGGILMKVLQELIYAGFIVTVLVRWFREAWAKERESTEAVLAEARLRERKS
ncbi:MAG: cytochrome c oxidase assembly factor CtaG [Hydrogenibacillus schlegelii]|uniref:Cytochrome c oxidase assembly factor CtaG n=1 Tax=Hydrogenibacillus schlegelii TaxID=1484 RepID=A0A947CXF5_HYDSH|nr:cytochrome c oxidase assembly factor CtaG [Hydrogenibacillus schlegelii]